MHYYLYLQFTNGSEGYYSYECSGFAYVSSHRSTGCTPAVFPSKEAATAKARRLCKAGYSIAYWEVCRM